MTRQPNSTDRRLFLARAGSAVAAAALAPAFPVAAAAANRFKAILFDGFAIFDPRPIEARVRDIIGPKGGEFAALWRRKQFEYGWLRMTGGRYEDFWAITGDALRFAASELHVRLGPDQHARLMRAFLELTPWPDVAASLGALRHAGLRVGLLSNLTERMMQASTEAAGIRGLFDLVLSTGRVRTYKPSPDAYRMGVEALQIDRTEILFVPFAGWDAAGAKWFGYTTFWVNRLGSAPDELGGKADASGSDLTALVQYTRS